MTRAAILFTLTLDADEMQYLLALLEAEEDFDEESRHLSEECSESRYDVLTKVRAQLGEVL